MYFLYYLLYICSSIRPLAITDDNYQECINNASGIPIFVEVWDKSFYESKSYRPTWKEIYSMDDYRGKIIFADLNCNYEPYICQKIGPGRIYPRFVIINTTTGETRQYTGGTNKEEIKEWIERQLSDPIEILKDQSDFNNVLPVCVKMSLFKFSISENYKESIEIATKVAIETRHLQIKMVMMLDKDNHEPNLIHYTPDKREVSFHRNESNSDNEFTVENLSKFIKIHALRFFLPYSYRIDHFSFVEDTPVEVFLYDHNNDMFKNRAIDAAKQVEDMLPTAQTGCEFSSFFCRYVGVFNDKRGVAVIIDKHNNLFWVSNLDKNVKNWTRDVLQGKVKGSGPGTGVMKEYLMLFYDMRAKGGWQYYLIFFPFGVLIFGVFIVIFVIACIVNPNPAPNPTDRRHAD